MTTDREHPAQGRARVPYTYRSADDDDGSDPMGCAVVGIIAVIVVIAGLTFLYRLYIG